MSFHWHLSHFKGNSSVSLSFLNKVDALIGTIQYINIASAVSLVNDHIDHHIDVASAIKIMK